MLKTHMKRPVLSSNTQKRSHSLADPLRQKSTINSTTGHNHKILTMLGNMKPVELLTQTPAIMLQTQKNRTLNGLNNQFLQARRQNYLNNGFNNRKNKLEQITIQNRKIHHRINSQKSVYSRDQMNKSYESNSRISRRLSQSKISRRSSVSSRSSVRSSNVRRTADKAKNKCSEYVKPRNFSKKYQIETKNIGHINTRQLIGICGIFRLQNENYQPPLGYTRGNQQSVSSHKNSIKSSFKPILPPIAHTKKYNSHSRNPLTSKNEGDFLHRIAEEMFQNKK